MVLRVNAALAFLALCLGYVMVQFIAPDANQFLTLFSAHVPKGADIGNQYIKIILLLLPLILMMIFMFRSVKGHSKLAINIIPAICVGLLLSLMLVPLLSSSLSQSIVKSDIWHNLQRSQDLIVSISGLTCLVILWLQRPKHIHSKDKGHKSH